MQVLHLDGPDRQRPPRGQLSSIVQAHPSPTDSRQGEILPQRSDLCTHNHSPRRPSPSGSCGYDAKVHIRRTARRLLLVLAANSTAYVLPSLDPEASDVPFISTASRYARVNSYEEISRTRRLLFQKRKEKRYAADLNFLRDSLPDAAMTVDKGTFSLALAPCIVCPGS